MDCTEVEKRLKAKEDPNTLLLVAASGGHAEAVKLLLEKGVSQNVVDQMGFSALDLACFFDHQEVQKILGAPELPLIKFQRQGSSQLEELTPQQLGDELLFEYLPYMDFEDYNTLQDVHEGCDYANNNGFMHVERIWLGHTYDEDLEANRHADVSVRWINEELGHGLFAEQALKRFDYVGYYTGRIIYRPRIYPVTQPYAFRYPIGELYPKKFLIDATMKGNLMRFLNHSDTPNLTSMAVLHKGIMYMIFFSIRDIKKGEQLCFDYGSHYWKGRPYIKQP